MKRNKLFMLLFLLKIVLWGAENYNGLFFVDKKGCVNKVDIRRIKKEDHP